MATALGLLLLTILIGLPVGFWLRSAASRKTQVCGQCGEQVGRGTDARDTLPELRRTTLERGL